MSDVQANMVAEQRGLEVAGHMRTRSYSNKKMLERGSAKLWRMLMHRGREECEIPAEGRDRDGQGDHEGCGGTFGASMRSRRRCRRP